MKSLSVIELAKLYGMTRQAVTGVVFYPDAYLSECLSFRLCSGIHHTSACGHSHKNDLHRTVVSGIPLCWKMAARKDYKFDDCFTGFHFWLTWWLIPFMFVLAGSGAEAGIRSFGDKRLLTVFTHSHRLLRIGQLEWEQKLHSHHQWMEIPHHDRMFL